MQLLGREIRWSAPPSEVRALEQITDIGIAFERAQNDMIGLTDTSVPAVFRSRQFLTDIVASLPLDEVQGRTIVDNPSRILLDPNPEITYHDVLSEVMFSLIDDGNGFLYVASRDADGNPKRVHVVPPDEMTVNWADASTRMFRSYQWGNKRLRPNVDVIHIAVNRAPGDLRGKGPIDAARGTTLAAAQAEEVMAKSMAEDNFTPSLVIKSPEVKTTQDAQRVLDIYEAGRDGRRKRPAVTGTGTELEQITFSPVDAQWIEGRDFTVQQIGRLFGIHGFFLLVESGSSLTYSTTESLFRLTLTSTLRPTYLERIEQGFSRLLPSGRKARFNTDEILRADIVSRYQAHHVGLGGVGFLTVNEVREQEGLSPIPGGDQMIALSTQPKQLPTAESDSVSVAMNGGASNGSR